jgi:ABC-type transport system involved in multi-copper enzyme maturation permease subunit
MEKIAFIAFVTVIEAIRAKVLYCVLFFYFIIVATSTLFGSVSIGSQSKVIKDFGLFSLSVLSVGYIVIVGATLLHKELKQKTIYNILSKPVQNAEFLIGKFFGLFLSGSILLILMSLSFSSYVYLVDGFLDFGLLRAYYFLFCDLLIVAMLTIFYSSIVVTPIFVGLFSLATFLAGRCANYIQDLAVEQNSVIASVFYWILPHLHLTAVSDKIVYNYIPSYGLMAYSLLYVIGYALAVFCFSVVCFSHKDFN